MKQELVLCAERSRLPSTFLTREGCVSADYETVLAAFERCPMVLVPRSISETDSSYKQIIPYVMVEHSEESPAGSLLMYERRGAEARLHSKWSVGIGGHIASEDTHSEARTLREAWHFSIQNGVRREITEEFNPNWRGELLCLGVINEENTSVGQVHLGIVFKINAQTMIAPRNEELLNPIWQAKYHCPKMDNLEPWSKLALQLI